ncbi:MAG TPA: CusA/CzcA family heavy metal efflux RND transporter [Fibrobacteria bacterium]|nr:CusA/CzcA family heavy metal efflux RND transporter [Fibrobacteria bacterium]
MEYHENSFLTRVVGWSIRNRILVLLVAGMGLLGGLWALSATPVDAIPDMGDTQVIVYAEYKGQSPRSVEDQVTYPLTTALMSVSGSKAVRGYSFFGYSLVYVLFEDGVDPYWARSRVLEYLNTAQRSLPGGVTPTLGPDGSGVGWVFEYALVSDKRPLQELRSLQDWYLKQGLASVDGVSEVASVGGAVKQYQIQADPRRLDSLGVSLSDLEEAVSRASGDAGGEALNMGEAEFMVRVQGTLHGLEDLKAVPVRYDSATRKALLLGEVATVSPGPEMRRGIAELDGKGEVVGGIVVMRQGSNALDVIKAVKEKLEELKRGLPKDVRIVPTYDRSSLILKSVRHLSFKLFEEMLAVALICGLFLLHLRSALVAVFTLPAALLLAFLVMRMQGLHADIMSLGGIAIAVGAMVDGAIILIENTHKHLERESLKPPEERRDHWSVVISAASEVGPALFWSLLVITVSFIPVFALEGQEGKLFKPLAYTKTWAMAAAALLSITVVPILLGYFVRGGIRPEGRNPLNRWLRVLYWPVAKLSLRRPKTVIALAVLLVAATLYPFSKLGSEFMPPLHEGDLLYMPSTFPGISADKAGELLQQTDRIIKGFPEVNQVFGKIGRAETATDPAGLDMMETVIRLKPEEEWRPGMTTEKLVREMNAALNIPGLANSWTMPIKTRSDMLNTGIRTPLGLKISGPNLDTLHQLGLEAEGLLRRLPGTSSVFAERSVGGNYLDVRINRNKAASYGLNISDVREELEKALGGMPVAWTTEGRERYAVTLGYTAEFRDNLPALRHMRIPSSGGDSLRLEDVADISMAKGPMVIRSEDTRPNAWVFVDLTTSDLGGYVKSAKKALTEKLVLPSGYSLTFSGQYESMERSRKTLMKVIPMTLLVVILLLFLNTRSLARTGIVLCAVPFSLVGAVWILYLLDYSLSVAVWIGMIALAGLDAETGVIMLLYLDKSREVFARDGNLSNVQDLKSAIFHGAVQRVRPKVMTASVILGGLVPILWSQGPGADVMKRIAAPMAGGVLTSVLLELAVYPALYFLWQQRRLRQSLSKD